jgi:hypothetical protein
MCRDVEVVVYRDPDHETTVEVFRGGQPADPEAVAITIIDPGKGWARVDWHAARQAASHGASPPAAALIRELYDHAAAAHSGWITST